VLIVADLHCGHRVGLTPPEYWSANCGEPYLEIQKETWRRYTEIIKNLGKIDILICNGDAIDGPGAKSEATELIAPAINRQVEMAGQCLELAKAKRILMSHGTPYHVTAQDSEWGVAQALNAEIRGQLFLDINGVNFDIKHEPASKSQLPHMRPGSMGRDWLSNLVWSLDGEQPRADISIRSHVHHHAFCGANGWLGMTTPALQGQGSKFGRRCSGRVDWGLVWFDIFDDGSYTWKAHRVIMESQKQVATKL